MKCYIPFGLAAILTVGIAASAWSQAGQSGGAGTAGTAGAAGASGTAGTTGTANTPGTAGAPGAAGTAGVGASATAPNANIGANPQSQGVGANPQSQGAGANPQTRGAQFNTNTGFNSNIPQSPFFTDPGVRRQLNLNDNQFNALNRAYQNAYGRYNRNLTGLSNNLTLQQRQLQMQAYANQFYDDFGKTVDTTFTEPRYRSRYDQLNWQHMGFNSFNNPMIQRQFNLTPQQLVQLRQLAAVWREQVNRMRRQDGNASINNIDQQQWATMYNQYWDQLNAVLTPEQQQMWLKLTGQRYNFPPNVYYGDVNGTTPANPNVQPTGPNAFLKGTGTPNGQNPPASNPQTPQGNNANAAPQGGATVR